MLQHNLKIAFRNFKKDKGTFLINLIGLSTGLACTFLIALWVNDEWSVDKFHQKKDHLYQVWVNEIESNNITTETYTPGILASTLKAEMPEVDLADAILPSDWFETNGRIEIGDTIFKIREQFVGKDFLQMFTFPLLKGNPNTVLDNKNAVLLSETLAKKIYGSTENIIGRDLDYVSDVRSLNGKYIVTGIFKDVPKNSTAQFDILLNYQVYFDTHPNMKLWKNGNPSTFLTLKKGTDVKKFNEKLNDFFQNKFKNEMGFASEESIFIHPYAARYLNGNFENGKPSGGRISYVKLFSLIAIFILLIACINFMNLSTAKAARKAKEIGVKKTIGANRKTLIIQYLSESTLIAMLSFVLALFFVGIALPQFNLITGKSLNIVGNNNLITIGVAITIFTGLLAGSYPALYLSGFQPSEILKGKIQNSFSDLMARKGLVVFQFTASVILLVSVFVIYQQINFIQKKNLGYSKSNVIKFKRQGMNFDKFKIFLNEVKKIPNVINASSMAGDLVGDFGATKGVEWEGNDNKTNPILFNNIIVYFDLLETLDFDIAHGRSFSKEKGDDGTKIILNEKAIEVMGLENPIGKNIKLWGSDRQIVGVTKNFHFESLYEKVKPCFFRLIGSGDNVLIKIKSDEEQNSLAQIEKVYKKFVPNFSFDYQFMDEDYQQLYAAEHRVATLSKYFAFMAILISCLGLFGLAAFTAQRRMKEISIRKVLGASVFSIVSLLSSSFMKMVLVALLVGLPTSYFVARQWLDSFAFRIDLSVWSFAIAGSVLLLIAWLTVGLQTLKAANVNPVNNLKE